MSQSQSKTAKMKRFFQLSDTDRLLRGLLGVIVCLFVSGCSVWGAGWSVNTTESDARIERILDQKIEVGDYVSINLNSGEYVDGDVLASDVYGITLRTKIDGKHISRFIEPSDITHVSVRITSSAQTVLRLTASSLLLYGISSIPR